MTAAKVRFEVYTLGLIPRHYFWAEVAKCLECNHPVRINANHTHSEVAINWALEAHVLRCRGKKGRP